MKSPPVPTVPPVRAFTLIELCIVLAVIAVLLAVLLPAIHEAREEARLVAMKAQQQQADIEAHEFRRAELRAALADAETLRVDLAAAQAAGHVTAEFAAAHEAVIAASVASIQAQIQFVALSYMQNAAVKRAHPWIHAGVVKCASNPPAPAKDPGLYVAAGLTFRTVRTALIATGATGLSFAEPLALTYTLGPLHYIEYCVRDPWAEIYPLGYFYGVPSLKPAADLLYEPMTRSGLLVRIWAAK